MTHYFRLVKKVIAQVSVKTTHTFCFVKMKKCLQVLRMLGASQMKNITKMKSHAGKRYGFIDCYFSRVEFHVKKKFA